MQPRTGYADLFLNKVCVGRVVLRSGDAAWCFGDFFPNDAFSQFSIHFGQWSMFMHEDDASELHEAVSDELRRLEHAIDSLHAEVRFVESGKRQKVSRLNIDGERIEWSPISL